MGQRCSTLRSDARAVSLIDAENVLELICGKSTKGTARRCGHDAKTLGSRAPTKKDPSPPAKFGA
jgi:hypothetical protein